MPVKDAATDLTKKADPYKGSVLVIDPKGDKTWITTKRRHSNSSAAFTFDPLNEINGLYKPEKEQS